MPLYAIKKANSSMGTLSVVCWTARE